MLIDPKPSHWVWWRSCERLPLGGVRTFPGVVVAVRGARVLVSVLYPTTDDPHAVRRVRTSAERLSSRLTPFPQLGEAGIEAWHRLVAR